MLKVKEIEIKIRSLDEFFEESKKKLGEIAKGKHPKKAVRSLSFQNLEEVKKTLTPKRLELLHAIKSKKPESIYALAKFVGRDIENVNKDIHLLKQLGFVELEHKKSKRKCIQPLTKFEQIKILVPI